MAKKVTAKSTQPVSVPDSVPPLKPNQWVTPEEFISISSVYGPRSGLCWYLYRVWPVIDRKLGPNGGDAKSYIAKLTELPGDLPDWMLKTWGSGDYTCCLTDASKPRGHTQVC